MHIFFNLIRKITPYYITFNTWLFCYVYSQTCVENYNYIGYDFCYSLLTMKVLSGNIVNFTSFCKKI